MFIPAVKEAESRLKCTSDVNYRESIEENNFLPLLSDREKDVLICVAKGMSNKEIAEQLYVSVNTVSTHRRNNFLQTGHPHFRRLCHLCSGAQAGAAGGHKIMAASCPPAAIGDEQKAFGQPLYSLMKPSFRKTAKGI